ncbi:MAG: ribosome biogenesis GTPase Der [PVC group bacterium]|nr:ribosome biogenesis GTPase Der [PVC group bacterium]
MEKENIVAIIGRPNVGKSCLFNRIVGKRQAIVESTSGITRDRVFSHVSWNEKSFMLVDTGGLHFEETDSITTSVVTQTQKAITSADIVLFVVDSKSGLVALDIELASFLRRFDKKIILVINKVDNISRVEDHSEFYELGFSDVCFVSALHNINIDELLDEVVLRLNPEGSAASDPEVKFKIALIGRPNVGKSSFLNGLLKEERVIVHDAPGTTRDTIDTILEVNGEKLILIDTAGIRKGSKTKESIDVYSRSRTIQAIKRSDICLVLVDAKQGILTDDLHTFSLVQEEKKCCVIAINKMDLVDIKLKDCEHTISQKAAFMRFAFSMLCSAKECKNLYAAITHAQHAWVNRKRKISQNSLMNTLKMINEHKKSVSVRGGRLKLNYLTQVKAGHPTFVLIVNNPDIASKPFLRYIEGVLRKEYDFQGSPITIHVRKKVRRKQE